MPHWVIKAAIQRFISWLPNSAAWNELFQQHVTRSIILTPQQLGDKLAEAQRYFDLMRKHGSSPRANFTALELGTGWHPVIPLALHLCGASDIWTFDIDPHLRRERLVELLDLIIRFDDEKRLARHLPGLIQARVENLRSLRKFAAQEEPQAWLKRIKIHCAVQDARKTGVQDRAVDFIFSSGVLEYIPVPVLRELLLEFRRVASPNAVMVHRLNLVDQFAYFDKSLSPFNHLKYTEAQWRWRSSPLIWQNRIRVCDYRRIFAETGFTLKEEENTSGKKADLERIKLAPEFQRYSAEDLLILHSVMTAVPDGSVIEKSRT